MRSVGGTFVSYLGFTSSHCDVNMQEKGNSTKSLREDSIGSQKGGDTLIAGTENRVGRE